jgi:hypothetical protein
MFLSEYFVNFPVGKNYHVEISSGFDYGELVFKLGYNIIFSKRYFGINLNLFVVEIDFDIRFKGDHKGFGFILNAFRKQIIDFEFYNIHHEYKHYIPKGKS